MALFLNTILIICSISFIYLFDTVNLHHVLKLFAPILLIGSFWSRIVLAQHYGFKTRMRSNYNRLFIIPLFVYPFILDWFVIITTYKYFWATGDKAGFPWNIILILAIVCSLLVSLKEGVISFSAKIKAERKQQLITASFLFYLYGIISTQMLWKEYSDKLYFNWSDINDSKALFEGFIYFVVFLLPIERYMLINKMKDKKSVLAYLFALIIGYTLSNYVIAN